VRQTALCALAAALFHAAGHLPQRHFSGKLTALA